ncbi:MAG: hypothetical protein H5T64_07975 [Chloroflexi bacterium]|nr:hypothetical protein [Chloroflexota bacterium]
MDQTLNTEIEYLNVVGGRWCESADPIGIFEEEARGRGNLYVLVETFGPFPDTPLVQRTIVEAARNEYFRRTGSVTAGLRAAVKAANQSLFEHNLNAPREERGIAGISCLVLTGEDAYMALAGPSLICLAREGRLQFFPMESPWHRAAKYTDVDPAISPPLGLRREIEPDLYHVTVGSGDVIVMASTPLVRVAEPEQIGDAVAGRSAQVIGQNLEALTKGEDLSALIIRVAAEEAVIAPRGEYPEKLGEVPEEEIAVPGWRESLQGIGQTIEGLLKRASRLAFTLLSRTLPDRGATAAERRGVRKPLPEARPAGSNRMLLWIALAIPLLVAFLFFVSRIQYDRSRQAHLTKLVQDAQAAIESADTATQRDQKKAELERAGQLLAEAAIIQPDDQTLLTLQQELQERLDVVNQVTRLRYFLKLREFPDEGQIAGYPVQVIVHANEVFVLDTGLNRVYKYLLTELGDAIQEPPGQDPILLRAGDQVGNAVLGDLAGIVWAEPGDARAAGNLLVLDKNGNLVEYDPSTGLHLLSLDRSVTWRRAQALGSFMGRFYLLDPLDNRILRFTPTVDGYSRPPESYLSSNVNIDLNGAVDMAIDGHIYVLIADGRIYKFLSGELETFTLSNLDEPLQDPSAIFSSAMGDEGYIYVADAGNQRIVQFTKEGRFVRQFRSDPPYFQDLRDLIVDEAERKLYVLDGRALYLVNIPPVETE